MIEILVRFLGNGGENLVFTGQSNSLFLELTNLSDTIIDIVPGAPANPPVAGGPFSIVLALGDLFTDPSQQSSLAITADGWTSQYFGGQYPAWVITRQTAAQWQPGETLRFSIQELQPTVSAGGYDAVVAIYNVTVAPLVQLLPVTVAVPDAGGKDLASTFKVELASNIVFGTKSSEQIIRNTLSIVFINTNPNAPIVPPNVPWGSAAPRFIVSFVYGTQPGAFALTTVDAANAITASIRQGSGWNSPVRLDDPNLGPSWQMSPRPDNHAILGTRNDGFVQFELGNIVTTFVPGHTQMYVQYFDIPGYSDGHLSLSLNKEYRAVEIRQFNINRKVFTPGSSGTETARGYLDWQVDNAMLVQLSDKGEVGMSEAQYGVEIERSSAFVLSAIDLITAKYATARAEAVVEPSMISRTMPPGSIFLWSGDVEDLPSGFAVCDGTNGTPDLRDRFVVAATAANALSSGVSEHTHDYGSRLGGGMYTTTTDGVHTHQPLNEGWTPVHLKNGSHTAIDNGGLDRWGEPLQDSGSHNHTVAVTAFPGGTSAVNFPHLRPRWYALLYVMKKWAS